MPEDGKVVVVNDSTGEVTGSISLGEPTALFALDGAVWVFDARLAQVVQLETGSCRELPFIGRGSDLRGCNLTDSVLVEVDLSDSDLRWARFGLVPMQYANLSGADLRGADMSNTILDGVIWKETRCPDGTVSDDNGGTCVGHLAP